MYGYESSTKSTAFYKIPAKQRYACFTSTLQLIKLKSYMYQLVAHEASYHGVVKQKNRAS